MGLAWAHNYYSLLIPLLLDVALTETEPPGQWRLGGSAGRSLLSGQPGPSRPELQIGLGLPAPAVRTSV